MLTTKDVYMIAGIMTRESLLPSAVSISYRAAPVGGLRLVEGMCTIREGYAMQWTGVVGEASQPVPAELISIICDSNKDGTPTIINAGLWPEAAARAGKDAGAQLFSLRPSNSKIYSNGVLIADEINMKAVEFAWIGRPEVHLYSNTDLLSGIRDDAPVNIPGGLAAAEAKTIGELKKYFEDTAPSQSEQEGHPINIRAGEIKDQKFEGNVDFEASVAFNGEQVPITFAQVIGKLTKVETNINPQRMALFAPGENKPWRGCEVYELNRELATLNYDKQTRTLGHDFIPMREELVKTIFGNDFRPETSLHSNN